MARLRSSKVTDKQMQADESALIELTAPETKDASAFRYEIQLDVSSPLITFDDSAQLHGRFRHFNDEPVAFGGATTGAVNVGVRLYRAGDRTQLFEDRMVIDARPLDPSVWTSVSVKIPRHAINFLNTFQIRADLVKEDEYWFESRGLQSYHEVELSFVDGLLPIGALDSPMSLPAAEKERQASGQDSRTAKSASPDSKVHLVFDVSDLIQYFHNARLPTGIQRVQIEVITNLIFSLQDDCSLKIACFTKESDTWVEVPPLFFNHICKLSLVNGDPTAPDWLRVLEELRANLEQASRLVFQRGSYLINLGTSWWLQNYFLHVRTAKARYGIRYVPYVHDCIPIMTPEHCVENLTRDFITWTLGAFQHADHILVNSKATAADVKLVAGRLGHDVEDPSVVTLDADYRAATAGLSQTQTNYRNSQIFLKNDIRPNGYVLFVSTVESRKNHLMAFSAWLKLAKKYGVQRVPRLVCVGNRGWLNDAIYAKLSASKILQDKVTMLSRISDPDLELLYRNCLFTLYPSSYEGWGLPVTESLCFGKVPVLARGSSLPEAGGRFGEYFDLESELELLSVLERMIFDAEYRAQREQLIAEHFRARPWSAIADTIVSLVRGWVATDRPVDAGKEVFTERGLWPFAAEPGRYYGLTENRQTMIWPGLIAGEMYRQDDGWWWTEPWGCWTKAKVAKLAFLARLPPDGNAIVFIGLKGVQGTSCTATVTLEGFGKRSLMLGPEQSRWLTFRVGREALGRLPRSDEGLLFEFLFQADAFADFRQSTGGTDPRVASIGVCGFMACREDDYAARMRFIESVALNDLDSLQPSPSWGEEG
jgi:glycosyltransferase involved in cell wall biosynthesis